jgi:beta-glucanase (GH16 family)
MTPSSSGFGSDWVFNQKFFLIMNLAMGGNLGGELDPSVTQTDFLVDYVKFYKVKAGGKYYGSLYKN